MLPTQLYIETMKNLFLFFLFFLVVSNLTAQVGIGTLTPQADLDVNGQMLIQSSLNLKKLATVTPQDENFKLLTRLTNSNPVGEITVLNVDSLTVAPINVVNYKFTNIKLDNLRKVNLQYSAEKYIVAISNFRYVGDPIKKVVAGEEKSIGAFVSRVYVEDNKWHLEIQNRFLDLPTNAPNGIVYHATLIIYDKSYFRHLPVIVTDLGGQNHGTASSIPPL